MKILHFTWKVTEERNSQLHETAITFKVNFHYTRTSLSISQPGETAIPHQDSKITSEQTPHWFTAFEKFYNQRLIFKVTWGSHNPGKNLKMAPELAHTAWPSDGQVTAWAPSWPWVQRVTMRGFSFPRFCVCVCFNYFFRLFTFSLTFKVINFTFLAEPFLLFASQSTQLYAASPLKRPESNGPLVHAYLRLPLLRAFNYMKAMCLPGIYFWVMHSLQLYSLKERGKRTHSPTFTFAARVRCDDKAMMSWF